MTSDQQRDHCRRKIFELVLSVERLKAEPHDDARIREGVERWETKVYEATKNDLAAYKKKITEKLETITKNLKQKQAAARQAPPASGAAPGAARGDNPTASQPPPLSNTSSSSTTAPTSSSVRTAATASSGSSAHTRNRTKEVIEEIREPLEQCRAILRILNVFGDKKDAPLKDDFLRIYKDTTETIKNQKATNMTTQMLQAKVSQIDKDLKSLRERLDPRFEQVKQVMQLNTLNEVVEQDAQIFGILLRVVEASDKNPSHDSHMQAYARRAQTASAALGGKHALKRSRMM